MEADMKLTKVLIVQSAIEILHERGLESVSMRSIAARLGVKAPALYNHVQNKQDILELISEEISKKVLARVDENDSMASFSLVLRDELKKIRDSWKIFSETSPMTPVRMQMVAMFLTILKQLGTSEESAMIGNMINNFILSFVADEYLFSNTASPVEMIDIPSIFRMPDMSIESQFLIQLNILLDGVMKRVASNS